LAIFPDGAKKILRGNAAEYAPNGGSDADFPARVSPPCGGVPDDAVPTLLRAAAGARSDRRIDKTWRAIDWRRLHAIDSKTSARSFSVLIFSRRSRISAPR
jgi:hypothetical protein